MFTRRTRFVGLALGALALGAALWVLAGHFEVRAQMERVVAKIREAGPLPFFAAMAVLPAIGFPLSVFFAMAGAVFGPTMGLGAVVACSIVAVAVDVALAYGAAAYALRPVAERLLRRGGYPVPDIPPNAAWTALFFLRLVPVTPFFFQNLVLGLARVPFGPYMAVSTLVPAAQVAAVAFLGEALVRGDGWAMAVAAGLVLAVGAILHVVRKRLGAAAAQRS